MGTTSRSTAKARSSRSVNAPRLVGFGIGPAVLGDVARQAGEGGRTGRHHFVHAGRRRVEPGEIAHRQLDAVENLGQRDQIAQLGESPQRLHAPDHGVQRLPIGRSRLERARRPVQRARDQRALAADERPHAGVHLPGVGAPLGRPRRAAGQSLQRQGQPAGAHRIAVIPLADPAHEPAELLDRLGDLLLAAGVPRELAVAQRPGDRLESPGGARDGLLRRP